MISTQITSATNLKALTIQEQPADIYIYIFCTKSSGKSNYSLCMKERLEILKLPRNDPVIIINNSSEFYGVCRHKPRFHMYLTNCTPHSTDKERTSSERVNTSVSINSQSSLGTISTDFSSEDEPSLCRPCTVTGLSNSEGLSILAVDQNSSFVDV